MSVRTAESPLDLGEMKASAVSFSSLQYEEKRNKLLDLLAIDSLVHLQHGTATPTATTSHAQTLAKTHVQGNPPPALVPVLKAVSAILAMS